MAPTNTTKKHVITNYVIPARQRGEKTLQIRVGNIAKELGWTNRTPSVFSTLSSQSFQRQAGLKLVEKRGGPASGGPSTTVQFVYKILAPESPTTQPEGAIPNGVGVMDLYGIGAEAFKQLGGGDEYLRREREKLQFPAEGPIRTGEHG
jgi:hypothetical protein